MSGHGVRVTFDEERVTRIFQGFDEGSQPGAAVGIAISGKPAFVRGFGLASLELPVKLTPGMRMRVGSVSKHFTGLALLLLCEEERAQLDDRVGRWLPELHPAAKQVTLAQLANHTSGLLDMLDVVWHLGGTGPHLETIDFLDLYRRVDKVAATPGTSFRYNNGGYLILSAALERIAGMPFDELLNTRIFAPAGMCDTFLRASDLDFQPNSATLHMVGNDGIFRKEYLGTVGAGAGGVVSTIDDLLRWMTQFREPTIGSRSTWSKLATPAILPNGTSTHYGFGLMSSRYRGVELLWHSGGVMGGHAQMLHVPSADLSIVTIVNRHDVSAVRLSEQIIDAIVPDLDPASGSNRINIAAGVYRSERSGRVVALSTREDGVVANIDGVDELLVPQAGGKLIPKEPRHYVERSFTVGDGAILFNDYGARDRLESVPVEISDLPPSERLFNSCDAGIAAQARFGSSMLHIEGPLGRANYTLAALAANIWRATARSIMGWTAIVVVDPGGTSFEFSTGRTGPLRFAAADVAEAAAS